MTEDEKQHACLHHGNAGGPEGVVAYRWARYAGPNSMPHGYITSFATHISTGPRDRQEELYSEAYVKQLRQEIEVEKSLRKEATDYHRAAMLDAYKLLGIDASDGEIRYKWVALEIANLKRRAALTKPEQE